MYCKILLATLILPLIHSYAFAQEVKLIAADKPEFDLGEVVYKTGGVLVYWHIKNISNDAIMAPESVTVWYDCDISPSYTRMELLQKGKSRDVAIHIYPAGPDRFMNKSGYVTIMGSKDSTGHKVQITECYPMSVKCHTRK